MTAPVWWWLSFASEAGFLGVAIVRASDMIAAVRETHRLGINPGGEVAGWPDADMGFGDPPERFRDRLLNRTEAAELAAEWHGCGLGDVEMIDTQKRGRMNRDEIAALARGVVTVAAGAAILWAIGNWLGWWTVALIAAGALVETVWCWRPW